MKDIVGTVGKYIRDFSKEDQSTVYTPMNIAEDMVNLLPDNIFKPDKKFIDIACKSGRFLLAIYNRLMSSPYMANMEPEQRSQWILDNQLYAIALTEISSVLIRKSLYDDYTVKGNIILINSYTDKIKKNNFGQNANGSVKTLKELLSEEFNQVNFDVVIGNPPYNNDIYLDFVTQGHNLAKQYDVWITPAKWQAKGGKKNEDFRKNIVPNMSKVVYYPDCYDIFDISEASGLTYYIMDSNIHSRCLVINKCQLVEYFNSSVERNICGGETLFNVGNTIISKLCTHRKIKLFNMRNNDTYRVYINKLVAGVGTYSVKEQDSNGKWITKAGVVGNGGFRFNVNTHNANVLSKPQIINSNNPSELNNLANSNICIFSSNSKEECANYISYISSKFIRFVILMNMHRQEIINLESWRFVPDPGPFDHIFTDAELYKKYNLTPEEINIIESVIKDRK